MKSIGSVLALCIVAILYCESQSQTAALSTQVAWIKQKDQWQFEHLCDVQLGNLTKLVNASRLRVHILPFLLRVRPPGSAGSQYTQRIIAGILGGILGWTIEYDAFHATPPRPYTTTRFTNVIATRHPRAKRRLVLACHYDSKITPVGFLGATDSAVPCSMMIEIAIALRDHLHTFRNDLTLQFIFFDGEEAFVKWSNTDSLYGSRHLAHKWQKVPWPPGANSNYNRLQSIDLLFLLDLIGGANPKFSNSLRVQSTHFDQLRRIEQELYGSNTYFQRRLSWQFVEDDHLPFYRKNVPVLHMISSPFPKQWHTLADNAESLDYDSIEKLTKIVAVFVAEYLHLDMGISSSECTTG